MGYKIPVKKYQNRGRGPRGFGKRSNVYKILSLATFKHSYVFPLCRCSTWQGSFQARIIRPWLPPSSSPCPALPTIQITVCAFIKSLHAESSVKIQGSSQLEPYTNDIQMLSLSRQGGVNFSPDKYKLFPMDSIWLSPSCVVSCPSWGGGGHWANVATQCCRYLAPHTTPTPTHDSLSHIKIKEKHIWKTQEVQHQTNTLHFT